MLTFKDLKIGDFIYEANIESKKIWIDKIKDISINTFFTSFKCIDQYDQKLNIDISIEYLNKSICNYGVVYTTNVNLLLTAICDS